ncbi:hypothetical protein COOONC_00314 [Cooperia oncophora]
MSFLPVTCKPIRLLSFIFIVHVNFVACDQLSLVVESFNLRSHQSTEITCKRITEILLNNQRLKEYHCIGGTHATSREPGMWIMATSPLMTVSDKKMPFEIVYSEKSISTIFELGDEVNRQLTSEASMNFTHENSDLNATMTYIQFRPDKSSSCSTGISTGFIIALIEGIALIIIGSHAAVQFYAKKRIQIHSVPDRDGEENLGINDE